MRLTFRQKSLGLDVTSAESSSCLFHGRGRQWPGLEQVTVDWLQGVLLVSLFTKDKRLLHDIVLGIVFVNRY